MKTKELTDRQKELLAAIESGVEVIYHPYMGRFRETPYYTRRDNHQKCTKETKVLLERGLVVEVDRDWRGSTVVSLKRAEEIKKEKAEKVVCYMNGAKAGFLGEPIPETADDAYRVGHKRGEEAAEELRQKAQQAAERREI